MHYQKSTPALPRAKFPLTNAAGRLHIVFVNMITHAQNNRLHNNAKCQQRLAAILDAAAARATASH
jgi:hypothetical protein